MNMQPSIGLLDFLVFGAVVFAVIFTVAWTLSPKLRKWIEQPKYLFQDNLNKEDKLR